VLIPRIDAGCPMADMITPESLENRLSELGEMPVVTYVNSSASVKARSTICCTSANVTSVVNSLTESEILMTPDRNLAQYAASKTNKKIHFWNGYCPIHDELTAKLVLDSKKAHPDALFIAHPECRPEIHAMADVITSTSGMIRHAQASKAKSFIVGTEVGLIYPLQKANPDKKFFPASKKMLCKNMKKISIEDIVRSLENMEGEVKVPEDIRVPALSAVERMINL